MPSSSTSCTYAPSKFEVDRPKAYEDMNLQENKLFDLDLRVKDTQSVTLYPLHHVTYALAKFEVAKSKSLGGDAFTRKYIICPLTLTWGQGPKWHPVPSTSCDLCIHKV